MPESKIHAAPASPVVCGCGQSNFGAPPAVGAGAKGSFLSIDRGGPNNLDIPQTRSKYARMKGGGRGFRQAEEFVCRLQTQIGHVAVLR